MGHDFPPALQPKMVDMITAHVMGATTLIAVARRRPSLPAACAQAARARRFFILLLMRSCLSGERYSTKTLPSR